MEYTTFKKDIIYPELSYRIVGCAFEVIKAIGPGHKEQIYQRALKEVFTEKEIKFKEQVYYPVDFKGKTIGKNYFDFLVEGIIIVELKRSFSYSKPHFEQVFNYLRVSGLKLAILISFGSYGASFKRIVNIYPQANSQLSPTS